LKLGYAKDNSKGATVSEPAKDLGLVTALVKRAVEQRLPRAEALKEKVAAGGLLDERDLAFLEEVFHDARSIGTLLEHHPEYQDIGLRMLALYKEITAKALENEQAQQGGQGG
jgi:hypothetical protein